MRHEFTINTSIEVDLHQIPIGVLQDELEERGQLVDNSELQDASLPELIDELNHRNARDWEQLCVKELIKALALMRCPEEILVALAIWERQPVVDKQRFDRWVELCRL